MGDAVVIGLLALGVLFVLTSAVGLNRFDDVFARMHAATKAATLGVILISVAAMLRVDGAAVPKLGLVVVLQLLTAPLGAHLLGRSAHHRRQISPRTVLDELADAEAQAKGESEGEA